MTSGARLDRSTLARLVAGGADRKDFLDRMATNELGGLDPGQGAPTFFLERTGRVVDRALVLECGDDALVIGSAGRAEVLASWLSKHVIADDVALADVTTETVLVTVCGDEGAAVLAAELGVDAPSLAPWQHRTGTSLGGVTIVRAEDIGGRSFHVIAPLAARSALTAALAALPEISEDAWRILRVQAGVPAFGEDFSDRTIPLETRQMDHFSFTKGCYVGQEVIARLHNFRRVKRALVRLRIEGEDPPGPGATLTDGVRDIGTVTSVVRAGGATLALGYVEAGCEAPGTLLTVRDGDIRRGAEVLPLAPA